MYTLKHNQGEIMPMVVPNESVQILWRSVFSILEFLIPNLVSKI
jgi:hypothetical protein